MMKASQVSIDEYIYVVSVDKSEDQDEEFLVELYPFSRDMNCSAPPKKVLHSFDELLLFLEEEYD